jgi:hypothetical protein
MNDKRSEVKNHSHSVDVHKAIFYLLDSYITDELEHDEREDVKQHIASCSKCRQQLIEIIQARKLITKLVNDGQYEMNKDVMPITNDHNASWLSDVVLAKINSNERGKQSMEQKQTVKVQQDRLRTKAFYRKRTWTLGFAIFAAVSFIALLIISLTGTFNMTPRGNAVPAPQVWTLQQGQTLVQNAGGTFALKYIEITSQEFRLFYALNSSYQGTLHVEAISYLASAPKTITHLLATVQLLGQLSTFKIGVIHMPLLNQAKQIISLQITLLTKNTPSWHIAPLKQLINEPHNGSRYSFSTDLKELPNITLYGPVMQEQVAFFKDTSLKEPTSSPSRIFLRLDDPTKVAIITQAEYLTIAGKQNFT